MGEKKKKKTSMVVKLWEFLKNVRQTPVPFEPVESCDFLDRSDDLVVSDLEGTLLRSASYFPYFLLVAFEAGSVLRAAILLFAYPAIWLLASQATAIQIMTFISFIGIKVSVIERVAVAVLPKFYLEDMHLHAFRVFTACGTKYVITASPRVMVEHFLKHYLGVDVVLGTEVHVARGGFCTGFLQSPGVLEGGNKAFAVRKYLRDRLPDLALGCKSTDFPYMALCKEAFVVLNSSNAPTVPRDEYPKPLIFHDGRIACRPTPAKALTLLLWSPVGIPLAFLRGSVPLLINDTRIVVLVCALLGVRIRVNGTPPTSSSTNKGGGTLFVCSHRTLLDPVFLSGGVQRRVSAVTYSISRVSEVLAPIKTVRLTRCRSQDARRMHNILLDECKDLVVCPEGTTCREPYLLRFSSLFAELSDAIVPVAMDARVQLFYGTTARGWKALDPLYFLMNPRPEYEMWFLDQLPWEMTCAAGNSAHDVANLIQRRIADKLGFQCTNLTRKDKYLMLAGNEGGVANKQKSLRRSMKRLRSKMGS
ncbi:glycerol-3-phosphate 2-O-acyltransferase 6 [Selaginella moellendorffii]|nr:glycerol-3-phosphate 2-O-acyltransferase 6 [Selaginella moellendorffii]XP_024535287.1 glycerol-3-phosphate 2-O-acyltransferase 6 [Selaginella moellendorffii]|eukprot:XP_002974742.2 glycerol-3-phosphate 2-O-acyltransferase 6 [Selaginella moellendorffii]